MSDAIWRGLEAALLGLGEGYRYLFLDQRQAARENRRFEAQEARMKLQMKHAKGIHDESLAERIRQFNLTNERADAAQEALESDRAARLDVQKAQNRLMAANHASAAKNRAAQLALAQENADFQRSKFAYQQAMDIAKAFAPSKAQPQLRQFEKDGKTYLGAVSAGPEGRRLMTPVLDVATGKPAVVKEVPIYAQVSGGATEDEGTLLKGWENSNLEKEKIGEPAQSWPEYLDARGWRPTGDVRQEALEVSDQNLSVLVHTANVTQRFLNDMEAKRGFFDDSPLDQVMRKEGRGSKKRPHVLDARRLSGKTTSEMQKLLDGFTGQWVRLELPSGTIDLPVIPDDWGPWVEWYNAQEYQRIK